MNMEFQYDVFLGHNAADKPRVRRRVERRLAAGLRQFDFGFRLSDFGFPPQAAGAGLERKVASDFTNRRTAPADRSGRSSVQGTRLLPPVGAMLRLGEHAVHRRPLEEMMFEASGKYLLR